MIQLNSVNVLLKPSHKRQLMAWLRRAARLGQRLGQFFLNLTLRRSGRCYEISASVHDSAGEFELRSRNHDWQTAARNLVRMLCTRLHDQLILRTMAV
jgi:hypothetical protein